MLYIVTEYAENGEMFGKPKDNLLNLYFVYFFCHCHMLVTNTAIIFLFQRLSYFSWSFK